MIRKMLTLLQYILLIGLFIFTLFVMVDGAIEKDIMRKKAASSVNWEGPLCSVCGGTIIDYFYNKDGVAIGQCIYCGTEEVI